jgi:hypothetical protein
VLCQIGTAVLPTSTPVYVASIEPLSALATVATPRPVRPRRPRSSASPVDAPAADRIHVPTFIGDVGRNTRIM